MDISSVSYGLLFCLLLLESTVVIGFFAPGVSTLVAASFLAGVGELNPLAVFLIAWSGIVIGDTTGYAVGRYAGHLPKVKKLITKLSKKVNIAAVQRSRALVLFQFAVVTRTPVPSLLGATGFRWRSWLVLECCASLLFIGTIVTLGYVAGRLTGSFAAVEKIVGYMQLVFLVMLIGVVIVSTAKKRRARKAVLVNRTVESEV